THPPVIELLVIGMKLRASGETLPVYTVVKTLAVASTVPRIEKALIDISSAGGCQRSMGLLSSFGDDIDYRVDGIRSPDGTAGASDDFDPVDILISNDVARCRGSSSYHKYVGCYSIQDFFEFFQAHLFLILRSILIAFLGLDAIHLICKRDQKQKDEGVCGRDPTNRRSVWAA